MSERTKKFLKAQWDTLITAVVALVLALLSAVNVLGDRPIRAAILAVLALLCVTIVKDRMARAADAVHVQEILARTHSIDDQLRLVTDVKAVPPRHIGRQFAVAWASATRWRFKGGTGTYLRAKTLPELARRPGARVSDVWIEVIAPDDVGVCETYGNHRRQQPWRSSSSDWSSTVGGQIAPWSTRDVRIEAYATVIAAIWYSAHTRATAHLALSATMSTFRFDLWDEFVMITNEDPLGRGMMITKGSSFFASIERELRTSFDQAREIDVRTVQLPRQQITADDVRRALTSLDGLRRDDAFLTNDVCDEIALKAISEEHAQDLGVVRGGAKDPYPVDR